MKKDIASRPQKGNDVRCLRASLMNDLRNIREEKGITQNKIAELSGVELSEIIGMETRNANPSIETVLKVLAPLGKTLAIVPIKL